jgi:quaternary ammonium compound-resistance protein SugE
MAWIYLILAGILEVIWAYAMKLSGGFTRLTPTLVMIAAMLGSFALLTLAMRTLPLGTSYMVWTGIGAVGAFIMGVVFLDEATSPLRLAAAGLILAGIVLMKAAGEG